MSTIAAWLPIEVSITQLCSTLAEAYRFNLEHNTVESIKSMPIDRAEVAIRENLW